jgi:hypothetical protein
MFGRRTPALPEKLFPLVLRREWRCDWPNPRLSRKRALVLIAAGMKTPRPVPFGSRSVAAE